MTTDEEPGAADADATDGALEDLLTFIRDSRCFDLTGYKRSSLARRIRKRMQTVCVSSYRDYQDLLEADVDEFSALFNTILINVTSFFRDIDSWNYLRTKVIPELVASSGPEREIRVWSAGCSSGEEAYSLAIAFAEHLGIQQCAARVKIYGTDVDDDALAEARAGSYSAKALERMPEELRAKYFEPVGDRYVFDRELRKRVIFGRHDVTRDAPISRVDLLSCRNTLMYFNAETQASIVDRFHFALREGGYLFLGKAEMLITGGARFDAATMRHRIFKRRASTAPRPTERPRLDPIVGQELRAGQRKRLVSDLALASSPEAMLGIDRDGTVALINGAARLRFGLTAHDVGRPFADLEISYRPVELRSVIERCHDENRTVRIAAIEHRRSAEDANHFDVVVRPLVTSDGEDVGTSVSFVDTTELMRLRRDVTRAREDLQSAYAELQSTNSELETVNEELQSSIEELETTNEELQSTNEELETTNEELETTNEELQSTNEELETMNEEMRIRTTELGESRTFLEGVLSSIAAGVIVLDGQLRVRSWSRGAEELWGLRSDEVGGEDFFGLDFGLPTGEIRELVQDCLDSGQRRERVQVEAINRRGRALTCAVSCAPLRTPGEGVVLLMEQEPTS